MLRNCRTRRKFVPLTKLCSIGDRRSWRQRNSFLRLRFQRLGVLERAVSFQITVLKVLAGHPDGRASVADLTRFVSILMSSGPEWTNRTRRLAARAPDLDIFGNAFVLRDDNGWQITGLGRRFLASLEVQFLPRSTTRYRRCQTLRSRQRCSRCFDSVVDNARPSSSRSGARSNAAICLILRAAGSRNPVNQGPVGALMRGAGRSKEARWLISRLGTRWAL